MSKEKLEPIDGWPFRSLKETRSLQNGDARGQYAVVVPEDVGTPSHPAHEKLCWARVRDRNSSNYAPYFKGCLNEARKSYLTCRLHLDRELAARELKVEVFGIPMANFSYISSKEKAADLLARRDAYWGRSAPSGSDDDIK